ncbi:unnamed protein product [Dicrocoelium dendriticum]|nr:unnamed protein product [Dicrocoelium dendriticum]
MRGVPCCPSPIIHDKQVPICPLCNAIVPVKPDELPDERVGQHIDTACKSKPALELKGKIFSNACSQPRCKKREAVLCPCARCGLNFCLAHRNELDHDCRGPQPTSMNRRRVSAAGAAAIFRAVFRNQNASTLSDTRMSTHNTESTPQSVDESRRLQEEEDRQLALALAASLNEQPSQQSRGSSDSGGCSLS